MAISTTVALAHATATISSSVVTLTTTQKFEFDEDVIAVASRARISCDTQPCRYRYDGSDPSTTVGHILPINTTIEVLGNKNVRALRFIAVSTDGKVSITLEG